MGGGHGENVAGATGEKECVRRSGSRRSYLYEPLIDRAAVLKSATKRFLEKMFDGTPGAMLSFFLHSGDLSKDEIEELSRLIEEMKR
ncbi:MAG: BlaI/MecI/CopY family transcriptional regulator [Lentisphaeria bacterium]|nr:MAG: BlaI/MecI/CopY family transcriptional regulator [Lentisphaeria bacterium]